MLSTFIINFMIKYISFKHTTKACLCMHRTEQRHFQPSSGNRNFIFLNCQNLDDFIIKVFFMLQYKTSVINTRKICPIKAWNEQNSNVVMEWATRCYNWTNEMQRTRNVFGGLINITAYKSRCLLVPWNWMVQCHRRRSKFDLNSTAWNKLKSEKLALIRRM